MKDARMGMPIDWAIAAMRSGEARPVLKDVKREKTSAEERRRALMTLTSWMAAAEEAHD